MKLPKRVFVTGAPGSRWSGIIEKLEESLEGVDTRLNGDIIGYSPFYRGQILTGFHKGIYFDPETEYEPILDAEYLDKPWGDLKSCRFVRSHHWAYCLSEIKEKFPDDWILMIYRPEDLCLSWWLEIGGFNITYPDYSYYKDVPTIYNHIKQMNSAMLNYGYKVNASWDYFTSNWIEKNFGQDVSKSEMWKKLYQPNNPENDVLVSLIKS